VHGCSLEQLCPCGGPGAAWANHGQYVACVTRNAKEFERLGLLGQKARGALVSSAARSPCGSR
jgi:hypothetical protein